MRLTSCVLAGILAAALLAGGCQPQVRTGESIARYVDGRLLTDTGNLAAALRQLNLAVQADPKLSIAHVAIGDIHFGRQDFPKARVSYEAACRTNPYSFDAHYRLGKTYEKLATLAKAARRISRLLRDAARTYLRSIELEPASYDAKLNLSACYFRLGKYNLAEQYCKEAIRIQPRNPVGYSNLGVVFDAKNDLYSAIDAYKKSLELDTKQPQVQMNLGSTFMRQNRHKSALASFRKAAALAPKDPHPWVQIGICHFRLENDAEAERAYQKALSLKAADDAAHRGLGVLWLRQWLVDKKRTDRRVRGLAALRRSLKINPNQPRIRRLIKQYGPQGKGPKR